MDESKNWYIVYTLQGQEKKVTEILSRKRIESYCPLNNVTQPGHWKKIVYEPLFRSYCFVKIFEDQIPALKQASGVISFIYWLSKPITVSDQEMNSIKEFLYEYRTVKLEKINLENKVSEQNNLLTDQDDKFYSANRIAKVALPSLGYLMTAEAKVLDQKVIIQPLFPRRRSIMQRIVG
ncbi:MAG TPA: UpxY family transcription antiterminator [Chitinophagaceae bacterium]|jgi:transcription antitermination factor NusG